MDLTSEVFKKNLSIKSKKELDDFCESIGEAIYKVMQNHRLETRFKYFSIKYYGKDNSGGRASICIEDEKLNKQFEEHFNAKQLNDFQEALNNFAWAIQNGGGGQ